MRARVEGGRRRHCKQQHDDHPCQHAVTNDATARGVDAGLEWAFVLIVLIMWTITLVIGARQT